MPKAYRVKLEVDPKLKHLLHKPDKAARFATKEALAVTAEAIAGQARANAPIDTGQLRGRITHEERSWNHAVIGTTVIYARIQEYGEVIVPKTKKMLSWLDKWKKRHFAKKVTIKPKRYIERAVNTVGQYAPAIFAATFEKVIKKGP